MTSEGVSEPARRYHHGNLSEALVTEATAMAARGGPDAVVLREVARRVGVSATAAYRHFAGQQALQHAVKEAALSQLAAHMRQAAAALAEQPDADPAAAAARRLVAIGDAYFAFALDQEGLFRCFCMGLPVAADALWETDEPAFGVLTGSLDDLVATGAMAPDRRPGADIAVWSAVHGLAMLCLDGPLAALPRSEKEGMLAVTAGMVLHGILRPVDR